MRKTTFAYLAYFDLIGFKKILEKLGNEKLDFLYSKIISHTQY